MEPANKSGTQSGSSAVFVSTISFREISLKFFLGKLDLAGITPEELPAAAEEMRFEMVSPSLSEFASYHLLPETSHENPFDRMLVWQCLCREWALISGGTPRL